MQPNRPSEAPQSPKFGKLPTLSKSPKLGEFRGQKPLATKRSEGLKHCLIGASILTIVSSFGLPQSGLARPGQISQQVAWGDFLGFLRRPRGPLGGKGELCLLVPMNTEQPEVMWHDRPLFIWKGFEQTVGVRRVGSDTVFWRRSLTQPQSAVNQIQYVGLALQPGQTYELLLFSSPTAVDPVRRQPFVILSKLDRATITAELQALMTKLKAEGASDETIAQRRAQYFIDRKVGETNLQADSLQEIYSVKNPSGDLRQFTAGIPAKICSTDRTQG